MYTNIRFNIKETKGKNTIYINPFLVSIKICNKQVGRIK